MLDPMKRIWDEGDDDYHIVAYSGHGKPSHAITCPRELWFVGRKFLNDDRASSCLWIVCKYDANENAPAGACEGV